MKNKKIKKLYLAIILLLILPEIANAGGGGVIASTAFNAVNKVSVAPPATVAVDQFSTTTAVVNTNASTFAVKKVTDMEMQSTNLTGIKGNTVAMYPYRMYLTYAVPTYVYYDWQYVQNQAMNLYINNYSFTDPYYQQRLMNLVFNDFTCYSRYTGIQQTLEFRAGTGITFQYGGAYPPLMPNYNPILSTKTFSAP